MSLKVRDIQRIMEEYAPVCLKEDYDNVGLMIGDIEAEVTSILVALDCTMQVIDEAIEKGCSLILTHHPLLFVKPRTITSETLKGRKILKIIRNNISLYSSHTNLDSVKDGINDLAVQLLEFNDYKVDIIEKAKIVQYEDDCGIGRLITLKNEISLNELCMRVKKAFDLKVIRYSGDKNKTIRKIAIINGSGEDFFGISKKLGADCIITGDTSYHFVSDISEEGVCIIDAGHFNTEWPAVKRFAQSLEKTLREKGYENKIYISEACEDPYKII
jgi:dinuclear metal center YbgI/SA1388 family protein